MLLESLATVMEPLPTADVAASISVGSGGRVIDRTETAELDVVTIAVTGDVARVSIEVPLGDAVGYWHPNVGALRTLIPDWRGIEHTSIVTSSPFGSLYDSRGQSLLTFAFDAQTVAATIRFGVAEERKAFIVHFEQLLPSNEGTLQLAIARDAGDYVRAIETVRDWVAGTRGQDAAAVAPRGLEPVYSTWYAFLQDIDDASVLREARIARELGCRVVFLDDGWQIYGDGRWYQGCGDWVPDTAKFPDFAGFVDTLHADDMAAVLWIAPLLLGESSDVFAQLEPFASHWSDKLKSRVIDPRHARARGWIIETCLRLMDDYGVDGLKIDFLDEAMVYAHDGHILDEDGYIADVGEAMHVLLADLRHGLDRRGHHDALIEFRQPYVGPAVAPFGNLVRADDCPADGVVNRRSVIDARLATASAAVHSDPMMWGAGAAADTAARQLMNGMFGVPQVSMKLSELPDEHLRAVRSFLQMWRRERETILHGTVHPGLALEDYPVIEARGEHSRIVAVYQPRVVGLGILDSPTIVLNSTPGESVVFRLDRAVRVRIRIDDATGARAAEFDAEWHPGLGELEVPAGGVATITPVTAA